MNPRGGIINIDPPCLICKAAITVPVPLGVHDMMLIVVSGLTWRFADEKKTGKPHLIGFQTDDDFVCHLCWRLMMGLEQALNLSTDTDVYVRDRTVQRLVRAIWTDVKLSDEAFDYRGEGKYFPKEFVDRLQQIDPKTWRRLLIVSQDESGAVVRCGIPSGDE